ncbi:MAG: hypothetical protein U0168_30170 [Nannocystaceae bacterium]
MGPKLEFGDFETLVLGSPRRALVVTPAERVRVGRARLEAAAPGPAQASALDDEIVRTLARWPRPVDVVLLRSWDGSEGRSWGFDPALDDAATDELAYVVLREQLAFFRAVIQQGVYALVATDLGAREFDAMLRANSRMLRELGGREKARTASAEDHADRWILSHLSLWTTRPYDEFVLQGLPELFSLVDRHRDELAQLSGKP